MSTIRHQLALLATAPALLCYQDTPESAANNGTILFYHGFTMKKEDFEMDRQVLASLGFLVVSLDNVGHGERRYLDFDERFNETRSISEPEAIEADFLQAVRETALEVPAIIDDLVQRGWARIDRLGIAGVSMGGFITYAAIVAEPRLRVATPILGSPEWKLPRPDSPHLHPDRFFPIALLSQAAANDETVPARFARTFHEGLTDLYATAPDRLKYIEYPDEGHFLTSEAWVSVKQQMQEWFQRFMRDETITGQ